MNAGRRELSRAELDGLVAEAKELGAKGLVWAVVEAEGWRSPVAKFLSQEEIAAMNQALDASEGELVLLVADRPEAAAKVLGALRRRVAERFGLVPRAVTRSFGSSTGRCSSGARPRGVGTRSITRSPRPRASSTPPIPGWPGRWPTTSSGTGSSWAAARSASTARTSSVPSSRCSASAPRRPTRVRLPARGAALRGAAARGNRLRPRPLGRRAHGTESIRDVIAFPKAASGADPLTGAPAPVDEAQLRELGIQLRRRG